VIIKQTTVIYLFSESGLRTPEESLMLWMPPLMNQPMIENEKLMKFDRS
jgi:hypothetical protein